MRRHTWIPAIPMVTLDYRLRNLLLLLPLWLPGGCASMLGQSGAGVPVVDPRDRAPVSVSSGSAPTVKPAEPYPRSEPVLAPRPQVDPTIQTPSSSPAVIALLDNANREIQAGRHDRAAASIERALRMEPQNAMLWSKLAGIRLDQQNWQQANVLAGRSNSLARNNRTLQLQNWRIIAQAKARMGDAAGAAAARKMILQLGEGNL